MIEPSQPSTGATTSRTPTPRTPTPAAPRTLRRIAILNRGEPAVRFCRALADYNAERGTAIDSVALYTEPDTDSLFTRLADDTHCLGPALVPTADGGMISPYLDIERVLAALRKAGCDAVWPGWGFAAEDAVFVARLEAEGFIFLGPNADAMERLGDKIAAKELAERCGVPLADWREIADDASAADVAATAARIGFPIMVKASAGGGGRGIRKVSEPAELAGAVAAVRDEVRKVFGAGGLLLEACVTGARHVEVQLVGGADGKTVALGVRDCSVQRRNQKLLEEAPSPILPPDMARTLCESSVRLAEMAGYRSAGTAEFLYQPATNSACFLEVNSRLQVEHTVTECVTGVDLVHAQIDVARGLSLRESGVLDASGAVPPVRGWSIEARLCAEDAARGFAPSPGKVTVFRPPSGPGIRVDSGIFEGGTIPADFDSMIAKVIATGATRRQAFARLRRALTELQVVIEDGATNKALLLELLECPEVMDGSADTGWLDRALLAGQVAQHRRTFEALCFSAIVEYRRERQTEINAFFLAAQGGIPQHPPTPAPLEIELSLAGQRLSLLVHDLGGGRYLVGPEGELHVAHVRFDGEVAAILTLSGERHDVRYAYGDKGVTVEVDGAMHTVEPAAGGALKAPAPAMVVQVAVQEGDRVGAGQRLLTLEAMKLEMPLLATEAGVVRAVLCSANQQVNAGQVLVLLEPVAEDDVMEDAVAEDAGAAKPQLWQTPDTTRLERLFSRQGVALSAIDALSEADAAQAVSDLCSAAQSVMLGYDVSAAFAAGLAHMLGGGLDLSVLAHPERWVPLLDLLGCFVDVQRLFDRSLRHDEAGATSDHSLFFEACRTHQEGIDGAPEALLPALRTALSWYGDADDPAVYRDALFRLHLAHAHGRRRHELGSLILRTAIGLQQAGVTPLPDLRAHFEVMARLSDPKQRYLADNARQAEYVFFAQPRYVRRQLAVQQTLDATLAAMDAAGEVDRAAVDHLVQTSDSVSPLLLSHLDPAQISGLAGVEVLVRRSYIAHRCACDGGLDTSQPHVSQPDASQPDTPEANIARHCGALLQRFSLVKRDAIEALGGDSVSSSSRRSLAVLLTPDLPLDEALEVATLAWRESGWPDQALEILIPGRHTIDAAENLEDAVPRCFGDTPVQRLTISWDTAHDGGGLRLRTFVRKAGELVERTLLRDIHPEYAHRFELDRLSGFDLERIDCPEPVYAFLGVARDNPRDERIFAFAGVRSVPSATELRDDATSLAELERAFYEGLRVIRETQARRAVRSRLHWNRLTLYVRDPVTLSHDEICALAYHLDPSAAGLGLEKAVVRCRLQTESGPRETAIVLARPGKHRLQVSHHRPTQRPVRAMSNYAMNVVRARRLGMIYPYELIRTLTGERSGTDHRLAHPDLRSGQFVEYDLDSSGEALVPVDRAYGNNAAAVVVGTIRNPTTKHPDGMLRVLIINDPTRAMCALAEPECRRVMGALDLAERLGVPLEWVAISAGAKIAMDSGTENLDWTARVLRRLVTYTQDGGVVHVIVAGVNVGAQSYWNAEATMLMHTRGLLIMTADGSCVLTGKKALEVSGSVAAEDERGIGGWERVMGPNGQAQLFAQDLGAAYHLLMEHYRFTWRDPAAARTRRHLTADPTDRDICTFPYQPGGRAPEDAGDFSTVGEIFSSLTNPGRKRPFDVRAVMSAVMDGDGGHLERFSGMSEGETAVIWDAHVGGHPVCMIGFESRPLRRRGRIPTDGPDTWTGGTLFPQSSRKVARAINAASGNRPVVVLANLSGFDGSPESLRRLQLEYGAEIGRAVVNFSGPIVFVVIGRYHGGAYVVFSKALNPQLTALALTGSYASVIGGGPAAAVVFPRQVRARAARDPRVIAAKAAMKQALPADRPRLRERLNKLTAEVRLEVQGQVAEEFDAIHTVQRAVAVGSLDAVIEPTRLRPEIIAVLDREHRGPPRANRSAAH